MSILHVFFLRGQHLKGKSNNGRSPRVHQASAMLWRKGSKPSFARLNNKVWVPFKVLPVVAISFPPPLPVFEETGSPPDDVQLNHKGVPHLYPHKIFGYKNSERRPVFLSFLMSLGLFFSPSIQLRIWFVCFCYCLIFPLLFLVFMWASFCAEK
jgi:hypothetical protein